MSARQLLQSFIDKANIIHNNKYDYSLSEYKNNITKIIIICPIHGKFQQTPSGHLKGGCVKCGIEQMKQTNLERYGGQPLQHPDVLKKQQQIFLTKYGKHPTKLAQTKQKKTNTNLIKYGAKSFLASEQGQQLRKKTMLDKYGVEFSGQSTILLEKRKQTCLEKYGVEHPWINIDIRNNIKQTWLEKYGVEHPWINIDIRNNIKQTWLEKYGVDNPLKNKKVREKQRKTNLDKYGCHPTQTHMVNILPLISNPEWLFDQYIIQQKPAKQIAADLSIDGTTIGIYLKKAEIQIRKTYQSFISKQWLQSLNIPELIYEYQWHPINKRLKADGYCKETNTIYEFHGDYWHGNPDIYTADIIHPIIRKSMGELYQKTIERENLIKSMGYNLIVIWENNFNNEY